MSQQIVQFRGTWLGLHRKADKMFYWIDGTPLAGQYSAWASGEPNYFQNNNESCVHTYTHPPAKLWKWNDIKCNLDEAVKHAAPVVLCRKNRYI